MAWRVFRSGKTKKNDVQRFELALETKLFALHESLLRKTYTVAPYEAFFVKDPKLRHIHKAQVTDRVVHQALFQVLYPIIDRTLSSSVCSARSGYGTHRGVRMLFRALRRLSNNWKREVWVLKVDIKKFFDTTDHSILKTQLGSFAFDDNTTALLYTIIDSFCTVSGKGLPLGNVTSQLFANIYLNEFDWFVKHRNCVQFYVRYCDDMVFVLKNKNDAAPLLTSIRYFLEERCMLALHPQKTVLRKIRQGIDFLGYVIVPHAVVLRTKTKRRILRKVAEMKNKAVIDSYLGVTTHAYARVVTKKLLRQKSLF